jgi:hypothetical protein
MSTGKRPLFLIPTADKTEQEIADEVIANLRAAGIEVTDDEPDAD